MTDWTVKVKTRSGYIKDVVVYDYCYPYDAVSAAMAQTDAVEYISFQHIPTKEPKYTPNHPVYMSNYQEQHNEPIFTKTDTTETEDLLIGIGCLLVPVAIFIPILWYVVLPMMIFPVIKYFIRGARNELF